MKFDKPSRQHSQALASTGIDAANWPERAKAFIAGRGIGFVIRGVDGVKGSDKTRIPATEPQWLAWLRYFDGKGIPHKAMEDHGLATVPCEWPEDFDLECETSDRLARIYRRPSPFDPDRVRTAELMRQKINAVLASSAMPHDKRRKDWNITPQEAEQMLREAASKPVSPLSETLRVKMGINKKEEDDAA